VSALMWSRALMHRHCRSVSVPVPLPRKFSTFTEPWRRSERLDEKHWVSQWILQYSY
jgi:hypothetical protein